MLLLSLIRHEPEAVERVMKRYHTIDKEYESLEASPSRVGSSRLSSGA